MADQVGAVLDPGAFAFRCADTDFLNFLSTHLQNLAPSNKNRVSRLLYCRESKSQLLQQAVALDIPPVHSQLFPDFDAFFAECDRAVLILLF